MRHAEQTVDIVTPLLHGPRQGRGAKRVAQQFPSRRQRPRRSPRCPGCLRRSMLPRRVHRNNTRRQAVGGPRCGRCSLFLHREILRNEVVVLDDMDHGAEQKNKQKPNAKPPTWRAKCWRRNSSAGWRNAPALNPKMRRGPKRFACYRKV
jgi:hypothetical protein